MKIEIDQGSGFCFGVTRAINKAEEELARGATLYCPGRHRAQRQGMRPSEKTRPHHHRPRHVLDLASRQCLLRAHGEPPHTYGQAETNGIEIIDATCPVVLHFTGTHQKGILGGGHGKQTNRHLRKERPCRGARSRGTDRRQGHRHRISGRSGQTGFQPGYLPVFANHQTVGGFPKIVEYIGAHISPTATFRYYDTICRQVANRMPHIRDFATRHDVILFVCGKKFQWKSLVRRMPEREPTLVSGGRRVGNRFRLVGGLPFGRHLRGHVHSEVADGGMRRSHPEADATVNTQDGASCPEENQPGRMSHIRPGWFAPPPLTGARRNIHRATVWLPRKRFAVPTTPWLRLQPDGIQFVRSGKNCCATAR